MHILYNHDNIYEHVMQVYMKHMFEHCTLPIIFEGA